MLSKQQYYLNECSVLFKNKSTVKFQNFYYRMHTYSGGQIDTRAVIDFLIDIPIECTVFFRHTKISIQIQCINILVKLLFTCQIENMRPIEYCHKRISFNHLDVWVFFSMLHVYDFVSLLLLLIFLFFYILVAFLYFQTP